MSKNKDAIRPGLFTVKSWIPMENSVQLESSLNNFSKSSETDIVQTVLCAEDLAQETVRTDTVWEVEWGRHTGWGWAALWTEMFEYITVWRPHHLSIHIKLFSDALCSLFVQNFVSALFHHSYYNVYSFQTFYLWLTYKRIRTPATCSLLGIICDLVLFTLWLILAWIYLFIFSSRLNTHPINLFSRRMSASSR